jgi:hypothetical protein
MAVTMTTATDAIRAPVECRSNIAPSSLRIPGRPWLQSLQRAGRSLACQEV